ncbi:RNA-binding Raly-like protein isoform X3 [Oncorhynchus mykiss]|uniref:RNA-binding Raly-like protein isoform X3 n=1 Tax=Oncorhynchus mykiss TaxID=8022 RepID=UPI0018782DD7|nr:RNA-binding Raly-like protein isoform X3 [Oncorhynchus mykiss]
MITALRLTSPLQRQIGQRDFRSDYDLDYECYQEDLYDRMYDYQRVPASLPPLSQGPSLAKRPRSSSTSSGHRRSRDRPPSKSSRAHSTSSNRAKLRMEELQVIKRELTLIKTQIDGLLDNLDRMDTQRQDHTGSPVREGSLAGSPYSPSASSGERSPSPLSPPRRCIQRESPELGEASDDDPTVTGLMSVCGESLNMNNHSSDPEDEM